jgi:hypothetical protein
MKQLAYIGDNGVKLGDAWSDTLTVGGENADDGTVVSVTAPTRARIALYPDRAKAGAVVLTLDSEAGADALIAIAAAGDGFTLAWAIANSLPIGRYYGDLRLNFASPESRTPWTPLDIILESVISYVG